MDSTLRESMHLLLRLRLGGRTTQPRDVFAMETVRMLLNGLIRVAYLYRVIHASCRYQDTVWEQTLEAFWHSTLQDGKHRRCRDELGLWLALYRECRVRARYCFSTTCKHHSRRRFFGWCIIGFGNRQSCLRRHRNLYHNISVNPDLGYTT